MKHVFVVNPTSGKGNGATYIALIQQYFREHGGDFEVRVTEYPLHATEIAEEYHDEETIIYSVGGDGTMKEVLDGINENVALCVIPGGTGNDFFKSITRNKLDKKTILEKCIEGENTYIDYGVFNKTSKFMNVCSFGVDADVNDYANTYVKKELNIPNSMVYPYSAVITLLHPKKFHMTMDVDGVKFDDDALVVSFANGGYYGGSFNPAPEADIKDGLFNISYFKNMKITRLLYLLTKYAKGTHTTAPECVSLMGKKAVIDFDREVSIQIDGEMVKTKHAEIEMREKALKYHMPRF